MPAENLTSAIYQDIQSGILTLLESARTAAARNINALMTASYWEIGRRIVAFEQGGEERAGYGEALIQRLAVDLTRRVGRGFSERNLEQMRKFYLSYRMVLPDAKRLAAEMERTRRKLEGRQRPSLPERDRAESRKRHPTLRNPKSRPEA